jgi:POT family proton-dependent oligopeptide transporter
MSTIPAEQRTFLGHPPGLFALFFAEMWERFSFYGMRALLTLYMLKGFLKYDDGRSYAVYGAYASLVYMTPFFGGLIADRYLGSRIAVIIGGVLMAAGHLVMTQESAALFYLALALLIVGNGFFKPNISTMVGQLYPADSTKRDAGFTLFYMGVNLGASISPLLCAYIAEKEGWHYGFGVATIGMLIGLAIFVMPNVVTQALIALGALAICISLYIYTPDNTIQQLVNLFVALCLVAAAVIAIRALGLGGVPDDVGRPKNGTPKYLLPILAGTIISVPLLSLFVSDFSIIRADEKPVKLISEESVNKIKEVGGLAGEIGGMFVSEISRPSGILLSVAGFLAFGYLFIETFRLELIARHRMYVVLILTFFNMLFWAFFEQAGSSVNNFTDRNVDRVVERDVIEADDVGKTIEIQPTQEQLGYSNGDKVFTLTQLDKLRSEHHADDENPAEANFTIAWTVTEDNIGMGIANRDNELPTPSFQSVNAIFILVFALAFTALWTFLGSRGLEPTTPIKFSLGLIQLGLGFVAFWWGAQAADSRGIVALGWLLLGIMFQTTGELCISPVGLSMVSKLSPKVLVSTVMGGWFLATAFSHYLAAIISQFTGVTHGEGAEKIIPPPIETVNVYGTVFRNIAVTAIISGVICLALSPLLQKWMHKEEP